MYANGQSCGLKYITAVSVELPKGQLAKYSRNIRNISQEESVEVYRTL